MLWFDFILKPILILIIAEFYRNIFLRINDPKRFFNSKSSFLSKLKMDFKNLKIQSENNKNINVFLSRFGPIAIFILNIVLIIVFPFDNSSIYFSFEYTLIIIIFLILINKIFLMLIIITSHHPNRIQTTKELISKIINYDFPIILCLIAIFIQIGFNNTDLNMINLMAIINFQQSDPYLVFKDIVPSMMIILNPFSFLGYISALIGSNREKNLGIMEKTDILNKWVIDEDFTGYKRSFLEFGKSIQKFILISLIFPLFFGSYWSNENILINIGWILLLNLIMILIIASIGSSRPRTKLDRTILNWIRTPHVFAFLAILYAFIFSVIP